MANRRVRLAAGVHGLQLPNGDTYYAGDEVVLSMIDYLKVLPLVTGRTLIDEGATTDPTTVGDRSLDILDAQGVINDSRLPARLSSATLTSLFSGKAPTVHTHPSTQITDFVEAVQDVVGLMVVSGANVTLTYDDTAGTLQVTATGGGDAEVMRDTIGAAIVGINGVQVAVNDPADTITISISGVTISQVTGLQPALDAIRNLTDSTLSASLSASFASRVPEWLSNHAYLAGELITHAGVLYQRNADGASGPSWSATNWTVIGGTSTVTIAQVTGLQTTLDAIKNLTDSTISTALAGAYYGKAAPSYAGARTSPYDSTRGTYGSLTARAAVRRARGSLLGSARTSLVPVTLIGDSATSGWKAGAIGTDDYATLLISRLRAEGYPVTGGWVFPANGQTPGDVRWTFGGANSWQGKTSTTNNYVWSTVAGNTATFSSTSVGTIAEVGLVCTAAGQSVTWSLDGGAQTGTFNLTANVLNTLSITGLTLGTHTITITTASTASNTIWLAGARVREATGLSITNAGIFGCHTDDWTPTGGSGNIINPFNLTTGLGGQPKLAFVLLGANDMIHSGHTLAGAKTNLNTIVSALKAAGTTVVQRAYPRVSTAGLATAAAGSPLASGTTWDQFISALYDIADTNDTVLLDNTALLGDPDTLEAGGLLYSDHLHLLTPGQAAVAHADHQSLQAI